MANVNQNELGKVIRDMQNASLSKAKESPLFNQQAANVVQQGAIARQNPQFNQAAADIVRQGALDKKNAPQGPRLF